MKYSRVNGSGNFRTATTTVLPNAQGSTVIHPTVRRPPLIHSLTQQGYMTEISVVTGSKSEYSPFVSVPGPRDSRTTGSSCLSVSGRVLSCAM